MRLESTRAVALFDLNCGGRLASLRVDGIELLVDAVDDILEWGCYPMAPWAGRVRNARFEWQGQEIILPARAAPHALHGTVLERSWHSIGGGWMCSELGEEWPWKGQVRSHVQLTNTELVWRMEVHAENEAFPVVMGWHPWFRRRLEIAGELSLGFEAKEMYERDASGIATDRLVGPSAGPWDDCFRQVVKPVRLVWSEALEIELSSSCDYWVVYSHPAHAICVEPQSGPPDGFNLGAFEVAAPGRPVCHSFRIQWRSKLSRNSA